MRLMSYKEKMLELLPYGLYRDDKNTLNHKEMAVYGKLLDQLQEEINHLEAELIVETASDEGLRAMEVFLEIPTDPTKPPNQRRSAIIGRLRGNSTVTRELIKSVADSYDRGTVQVTEDFDQYAFQVKFIDTLGIPSNLEDLKRAIEEIKPAHLKALYEFSYYLIKEIHGVMTINELQNQPLHKFAGGRKHG